MDFYYMIKDLDDEQIRELISLKIDNARYQARDITNRFIGVNCGINPTLDYNGKEKEFDSQAVWQGFIPEDVKIIYSFVKNEQGYTVNNGCYYYINDNDFIYEFAKYIKEIELESEMEFLTFLKMFMDKYFNGLSSKADDRHKMHQPLVDSDGKYVEPSGGHSFSDFKNANTAMCSEYSAMAQNILTIFGYQIMYLGGSVNSNIGSGGHAFNMTIVDGSPCVIDFTIPTKLYTMHNEKETDVPFVGYIEDFNPESLRRHMYANLPFHFNDYYYLLGDEDVYMISTGEKRHYVIGNVEYYNEKNEKLSK